jgi:hypothetical protein
MTRINYIIQGRVARARLTSYQKPDRGILFFPHIGVEKGS